MSYQESTLHHIQVLVIAACAAIQGHSWLPGRSGPEDESSQTAKW